MSQPHPTYEMKKINTFKIPGPDGKSLFHAELCLDEDGYFITIDGLMIATARDCNQFAQWLTEAAKCLERNRL